MDTDFALAYSFIDATDGKPRQLRFRHTLADQSRGQLVAVVANGRRTDNGDTLPISRPGVKFEKVQWALSGWQIWARLTETQINLTAIREQIRVSGLA
ncbi:hypothetical protein [Mycolicibacterium mageritense]|uniref:hypothetical protein n=1 Tax=Mycolicibacterium mageritense TaxID=53462 RepID=UPI0011DBAA91|nr:hypothetical protein [Mycolicibacterium mageritense]TXI56477.1 MAG: hypothetical protein E6Q55_28850 [Mycolicibacterium mageritense]